MSHLPKGKSCLVKLPCLAAFQHAIAEDSCQLLPGRHQAILSLWRFYTQDRIDCVAHQEPGQQCQETCHGVKQTACQKIVWSMMANAIKIV